MPLKHSKLAWSLFLTSSLAPISAHCEIYLSEEAAVKTIFPSEVLQKKTLDISSDEIKEIEGASGEKVRTKTLNYWVDSKKNAVFIDQVLGKHEFITVAVGITGEGKVKSIEIIEYRETYGQQIRGADWRKQFVGKDVHAPLKVNQDIVNISGATLSSAHVSAGVRRVLKTYEVIIARL